MKDILTALWDVATNSPHRISLISDRGRWTFQRLVEDVERAAGALLTCGVRPGDRVALHMTNLPEMAICILACFRIGAIAAPLNSRLKAEEISALVRRLQPKIYIGQNDLCMLVSQVEHSILPAESRFVVGPTHEGHGCPSAWVQRLADDRAVDLAFPSKSSPILLLTTSGTSGQPKFVAHSLASLSRIAEGYLELGMIHGDIAVNSCPLAHASGLFTLVATIYHAGTTILVERFDADVVLDAIVVYRGAWVIGLPVMHATMLERQRARPRDMSSLRFCMSVGDVCPAPLQLEFPFAFGRPLHTGWGMTETVGLIGVAKRSGAVSRALPGVEMTIVDDAGCPCDNGMSGELLIRDPNFTLGYWSGPGQIEPCGPDGWLATGDIMRHGEGDELWYVSRKKDLIVRGGSKISPIEVEQTLKLHPSVHDAAVLGVPDPVFGQRVEAFIEVVSGFEDVELDDILATARTMLADYKLPERLRVVRQIPRNAQGKIERKSLPALLSAPTPV